MNRKFANLLWLINVIFFHFPPSFTTHAPASYFELFVHSVPYCTKLVGRESSGGIATPYGLDGPGIESRWGEIFCIRSDRPWGPPGLLYNGYRVSFQGIKRPGRGVDPHHPSSQEREERVELYLYPSGPLWPVLERILPLTVSILQRGTLIFVTDLRIYAWWITFFYYLFHPISVSLLYSLFMFL